MRRTSIALLALTASACAAADPVGVSPQAVAIPGDWVPPAATLAISNPQYVDVVEPPPVLPDGHCDSVCPTSVWGACYHPACTTAHPGTTELDRYVRGRWTYVNAGGVYTCRRNSNPHGCTNLSVHSIGRAIDLMIPQVGGDADNTAGDAVANWLIENAEYVGIQRVIWDGMYWNGSRRGAHFSEISDELCGTRYCTDHHTNHIHVELSVDGAARRTRFFTEGPPPTTCPVVCYGTAAVRADCTYEDCAASGQVCLDGPVRCGPGAPPEPLTATLNASATAPSITTVAALSRYQPITPTRLFDTRTDATSALLVRSDGATSGPLTAARTGTFSSFGAPAGTTSVFLNVAAVPLTAPGFLTAFAAGPQPAISTVNFAPPRVRANAVAVALGTGGGVTFAPNVDVEVVTDMSGAFVAGDGLGLQTAGPLRVLDTRSTDTPLVAGTAFSVPVGAPAGAGGVVASVTVIQPNAEAGFVTAFPCGTPMPSTSSINFIGASVTSNAVVSALGADGQLCLVATQPVHVVVDVTGFLVPTGELSYQAVAPVRLLDTRDAASVFVGRLGAGQVIELPIQTLPGMPADVHAIVANLTTVSTGTRGFITAYPCGMTPPSTSSLNFDSDNPAGALTISAIGGGSLCVFANQRTHLIVDLLGVWVPTPGAAPPTDGPGPAIDMPENMDPTMEVDAGAGADGASGTDGGAGARGSMVTGSCGCRAGGARTPGGLAMVLAGVLLARIVRRRHRAPR